MILLLSEKFSTDSKVHWRMSNVMICNIIATMLDLTSQDPSRSIRSLNINAKEHIKVLKESVMPGWMTLVMDVTKNSSRLCACGLHQGHPGVVPGEPLGGLVQRGLVPKKT